MCTTDALVTPYAVVAVLAREIHSIGHVARTCEVFELLLMSLVNILHMIQYQQITI